MTDGERILWIDKCSEILHLLLVEIRNLSYEDGNAARINMLADIAHNIPHFMVGQDDFVPDYLRSEFVKYARKYHPDTDPAFNQYVYILDASAATFRELYRTNHPWPEPVGSTA
jgi:hypothetical protein